MGSRREIGLCAALVLCILCGTGALAERVPLTGAPEDYSKQVTAIAVPAADNPVIAGENPLTGEAWTGEYKPVMVSTALHPLGIPALGREQRGLVHRISHA